MTYLEKWFDFNRRQKEIESLLEETVANQSEQSLTLKEFYLLYYLDLAQEKSLRQIDLPDKLHLSPSAVSRMVARLEAKNCGLLSRRCCDQDRSGARDTPQGGPHRIQRIGSDGRRPRLQIRDGAIQITGSHGIRVNP